MPTFVGFGGAASSSLLTASTPDMALPGYADDRELVDEDGGGDDNGIADEGGAQEQGFGFAI